MLARLQQDLITAMKAKDSVTTGALRLLMAAVKNQQIEVGHELSEDEFSAVVQKEVKQRKDSLSQYEAAGRDDLAQEERAEMEVLMAYMPAQMSEQEALVEVEKAIESTGAVGAADMGKVMGALAHLKGQVDMGMVSKMVKERLG